MDKTTAGQKGSGGLQDVELKRRVGGIYGGGGGGGGREKEREGKEDDDRLKHFWSIGSQPGANCVFESPGQDVALDLCPRGGYRSTVSHSS